MWRDWLGSLSLEQFRADYLQRMPLAHPATARAAVPMLDWNILEHVLGNGADILVVARGKLLELPAPRDADEVRAYLRIGVGLCLRHTENCHPALRKIADGFETDLGTAQVQLFVTPGGTHGFGWHYDDEDVFIAQTLGVKDYYFRANTVTTAIAAPAEFQAYPTETSTLRAATLVAGDFLYIPARWWHMAVCHETSLSISVGVRPRDQARRVA
ncbi:MAG TPA: cupin domain-containing protein [Kofleriaceae bacterium]|nr:cupin domain-containing protein [Kofleriaceae bacterium]